VLKKFGSREAVFETFNIKIFKDMVDFSMHPLSRCAGHEYKGRVVLLEYSLSCGKVPTVQNVIEITEQDFSNDDDW
jgi:hypothetical protein